MQFVLPEFSQYEGEIPGELRTDCRQLSDAETRALRLKHSRFFVFGDEESYGYLGAGDFANETFVDEEGDEIPKEKMVFVDLEDGRAFAVRPSGTEPKIKFYLYQRPRPGHTGIELPEELDSAKAITQISFDSLKAAVVADMRGRLG